MSCCGFMVLAMFENESARDVYILQRRVLQEDVKVVSFCSSSVNSGFAIGKKRITLMKGFGYKCFLYLVY